MKCGKHDFVKHETHFQSNTSTLAFLVRKSYQNFEFHLLSGWKNEENL